MSNQKKEKPKYTEVWGDTVELKELIFACLIGVFVTMSFFFAGQYIFSNIEGLDEGMASGYALLLGLGGCVLSGVISSVLFKPKRTFDGELRGDSIEHILEQAGMSVEEEASALAVVSPEIIAEMEELELYSLLALVPEDSPNYKPEYKEKAHINGKQGGN